MTLPAGRHGRPVSRTALGLSLALHGVLVLPFIIFPPVGGRARTDSAPLATVSPVEIETDSVPIRFVAAEMVRAKPVSIPPSNPPVREEPKGAAKEATKDAAKPVRSAFGSEYVATPAAGGSTGASGVGQSGPETGSSSRFFGKEVTGRVVVYAIDRSNSMALTGGLYLARRELLASLERLPETTLFQVIVFNRSAESLRVNGKEGLLEATAANKRAAAVLLNNVTAEGGTDHLRALRKALALAPDTLFFLTDADDLTDGMVADITRINQVQNRGKTVIHAIELNIRNRDRDDMPLHALARLSHGTYQSVRLDVDR